MPKNRAVHYSEFHCFIRPFISIFIKMITLSIFHFQMAILARIVYNARRAE